MLTSDEFDEEEKENQLRATTHTRRDWRSEQNCWTETRKSPLNTPLRSAETVKWRQYRGTWCNQVCYWSTKTTWHTHNHIYIELYFRIDNLFHYKEIIHSLRSNQVRVPRLSSYLVSRSSSEYILWWKIAFATKYNPFHFRVKHG